MWMSTKLFSERLCVENFSGARLVSMLGYLHQDAAFFFAACFQLYCL